MHMGVQSREKLLKISWLPGWASYTASLLPGMGNSPLPEPPAPESWWSRERCSLAPFLFLPGTLCLWCPITCSGQDWVLGWGLQHLGSDSTPSMALGVSPQLGCQIKYRIPDSTDLQIHRCFLNGVCSTRYPERTQAQKVLVVGLRFERAGHLYLLYSV